MDWSYLGNYTMGWEAAIALIVLVSALSIAVGVPVWASVIKKRPTLFGRKPKESGCDCDCHTDKSE